MTSVFQKTYTANFAMVTILQKQFFKSAMHNCSTTQFLRPPAVLRYGTVSRYASVSRPSIVSHPLAVLRHTTIACLCTCQINMATKKAKSKKKAASSSKIDFNVADGIFDIDAIKKKMEKLIIKYQNELVNYSPKLSNASLDNISVKINAEKSLLYEVSSIVSSPKEFIVTPMVEGDQVLKHLMQSLQTSNLYLNPRLENKLIKIPIPLASSERRESMLKQAKVSSESIKVAIRKVRQQGLVDLRKSKDEVSKDDIRRIENQIQLVTDNCTQQVEKIFSMKEKELKV